MLREEILNNSRELVNQIYSKMGIIESCDTVAEKVKDLDVCFSDSENNKIVVLDEILNAEQLTVIREGIIDKIYENAKEAQDFLERLNRKPAIPNQEFEQAVNEMVEQSKPVPAKEKEKKMEPIVKPEMTIEEVKRLYHDEKKPMKEVAEYFGVTKSVMNNFIHRNHLSRTTYDKDPLFRDSVVEAKRKKP